MCIIKETQEAETSTTIHTSYANEYTSYATATVRSFSCYIFGSFLFFHAAMCYIISV